MRHFEIYVNGKIYASREYEQAPRQNDVISIGGKPYLVRLVFWADPDEDHRNQLHVEFFTGQN